MARKVLSYDDATGQRRVVPAASSPGMAMLSDSNGGPVWGVSDLPDVPVTAATATLGAFVLSGVTGVGPYSAPTPAASVTTPPQRFGIRNDGNNPILLNTVSKFGQVLAILIGPGEQRNYRQTSTSGYSLENGIPLKNMDDRYLNTTLPPYLRSSTLSLTNAYDPDLCVYNWRASQLRRVMASLALVANGGLAEWLFVGDSLTGGSTTAGGTFQLTRSWPYYLGIALAAMGYPIGGTGLIRADAAGNRDPRIALAGTGWTAGNADLYTANTGDTFTVTNDFAGGVAVDVWWYDFAGGSGVIDGSVSVNGATSGSGFVQLAESSTEGWKKTTLATSVEPGATIKLTKVAGGAYLDVLGVQVRAASGLIIHNIAQGGSTAAGTAPQTAWADNSGLGLRRNFLAGFASGAWCVSGNKPPSFVSAVFGANDQQQGFTPAQTATALGTIFGLFPNSDKITGVSSQVQPVSDTNWDAFAKSMFTSVADPLSLPLYDMYSRLGSYTTMQTNGLTVDGQGHLLPFGNAMIGDGLARAFGQAAAGNVGPRVATGATAVNPLPPNSWTRTDTTAAAVIHTLTAAPTDTTPVLTENTASTGSNLLTVQRGGTDVMDTGATSFDLAPGERAESVYRPATAAWQLVRFLWRAIAGTNMRRSPTGTAQVADPVAAQDIATKNYVDTKRLSATATPAANAIGAAGTAVYATPAIAATANGLAVGDTFRFSVMATNTATIQTPTFTTRIGTAGTVADTAAATLAPAAGTAAAGNGRCDVTVTIRSLGATGTAVIDMRFNNGTGVAGFSASQTLGSITVATIDTTTALRFGVALASSVAGLVTIQDGVAELVRKA